jgi:hypothetical protein
MNKNTAKTLATIARSALRSVKISSRRVACYVVGGEVRLVVRDASVNSIALVRHMEAAGLLLSADTINAAPGVPCFRVR